jgi:hypothetical protein
MFLPKPSILFLELLDLIHVECKVLFVLLLFKLGCLNLLLKLLIFLLDLNLLYLLLLKLTILFFTLPQLCSNFFTFFYLAVQFLLSILVLVF